MASREELVYPPQSPRLYLELASSNIPVQPTLPFIFWALGRVPRDESLRQEQTERRKGDPHGGGQWCMERETDADSDFRERERGSVQCRGQPMLVDQLPEIA